MRLGLLAAFTVVCASCAITPIALDDAVVIAMRELEKRRLPLPQVYDLEAHPDKKAEEAGTKYVWAVSFSVSGSKRPLYLVWINQYTRNVEVFRDYRGVRSGEARRARFRKA
jgi:hypothetical protein